MIFCLDQPLVLLGLAAGFLLSTWLRSTLQHLLAGSPRGGWRRSGVRRWGWLDPYGTAAAALWGAGWAPRPDVDPRRRGIRASLVSLLVVGVGVPAACAAGAYAGFVAVYDHSGRALEPGRSVLGQIPVVDVLHGGVPIGALSAAAQVLLGVATVNLAAALVALVPVPPTELGVLVWSRLPRTPGARRAAYHLLDEDWGAALLLALLLIPLVAGLPILISIINAAGNAILGALS